MILIASIFTAMLGLTAFSLHAIVQEQNRFERIKNARQYDGVFAAE